MKAAERTALEQAVRDQRKWIEEHGGNSAGYVLNYGEKDGPGIYAADKDRLVSLLDQLK